MAGIPLEFLAAPRHQDLDAGNEVGIIQFHPTDRDNPSKAAHFHRKLRGQVTGLFAFQIAVLSGARHSTG
jgi:hypothetical protein